MPGVPLILLSSRDEKMIKSLHRVISDSVQANFTASLTGKIVIERAKSREPQLIVIDINYDDMSCIELVDFLKKDAKTAHIPVILISEGNITEFEARKNDYRFTGVFNLHDRFKFLAMIKNILE